MANLIFTFVSLVLLVGFLALTWYEKKRGTSLCAAQRARLDRQVERTTFIFTHVNLGAFLADEARRIFVRVGHDIAHLSLLVVRAVERLLTRLVRHLRTRRAVDEAPRESVREFVRTLSDFKGHLKATRPEMPEIE